MVFSGLANPLGLLGLLVLPIILALHLLRQRRKRMVVSSLQRWQFLEQEVRGSRLQRIPLTWLLICDLLIAALLAFALAQPQLEASFLPGGGRHVVILIDISNSMRARDVLPDRISAAKAEATGLLGRMGPADRATVVSFAGEPTLIGDTRQHGAPELIARVAGLQAGPTGHNGLKEALAMGLAAYDTELPLVIHILTDAAYPEPTLLQENLPVQWHVYGRPMANQAIVGINAEVIDENAVQVVARVANFSSGRHERIITLRADDAVVDSLRLSMEAGTIASQSWTVRGRPRFVTAELAAGDELPEDDSASLGLHQSGQIGVTLVAEDPQPIQRALEAAPYVNLQVITPAQYRSGLDAQLVVFREFLPEQWPNALILVVDPPRGDARLPVDALMPAEGPLLTNQDPALQGADFSSVRWSQLWQMESLPPSFAPILQIGNAPLLSRGALGNSPAYLLLAELRGGNFTRHPAFPVFIANLTASASTPNLPPQMAAGSELPLPPPSQYPQVDLQGPGGMQQSWAADRPARFADTTTPGPYTIRATDWDGNVATFTVGINAGEVQESNVARRQWAGEERVVIAASTADRIPISLTPWLLALVLILLLVEARLAWR